MPTDPIKHVVVLMLENHSFDHLLGGLKSAMPDLEGVDPAAPGQNRDSDGTVYSQVPTTETSVKNDPKHDLTNVLHQIEGGNGNFVTDYSQAYPDTNPEERGQIMGYFPLGSLGPLHELAQHFTVCDRWFSSVPGPTWTNRFFVHSGTSLGRVKMPENTEDGLLHPSLYFGYDQDTIYDRLDERGVSWRIYHGDIPQSLVFPSRFGQVVAVESINSAKDLSDFTNRGNLDHEGNVHESVFVLPGGQEGPPCECVGTTADGTEYWGTSFAAAYGSATVAAVWSRPRNSGKTAAEILGVLRAGTDTNLPQFSTATHGKGLMRYT